jgi:probable biosynthetic protein (TIGR04098 family)
MHTKEIYIKAIKNVIDGFTDDLLSTPIATSNIDSIDLVTVRVDIESIYGKAIPDSDWVNFKTLNEIVNYCTGEIEHNEIKHTVSNSTRKEKNFSLNMPQMAIEALSENWLLKELGDFHWELLCEGLNTNSFSLKDELDNRLYATFVRIRIEFPVSLREFEENETFTMGGDMNRYGNGMYFSKILSEGKKGTIKADLMTSFSVRSGVDNTTLMKSQPAPGNNAIESVTAFPSFGEDYRQVKKGIQQSIESKWGPFQITDNILFSKEYHIHPFYDLNGAGLLYFAAYPIINDVCESSFFTTAFEKRWEIGYYTVYRDIFYFANCNINDAIEYKLNSYEKLNDTHVKITSSLYRKNDNVLMARIFTIKKAK